MVPAPFELSDGQSVDVARGGWIGASICGSWPRERLIVPFRRLAALRVAVPA
jgi:hypothetical protein